MMPKLIVYENKKKILNEDNYYELFEQEKFREGYKGYLKSKYDLSIDGLFSVNIPTGIVPVFDKGGIVFMPIDKPFPNNVFFIETDEVEIKNSIFEVEVCDWLSEEIEDDTGGGIIYKLSIGDLIIYYTWVSFNQFKFYIHNGFNVFKGYGFYLDDINFERKKIRVNNWLSAFRGCAEVDTEVIINEKIIITDLFREKDKVTEKL